MQEYGTVYKTETCNFCFQIPEIRKSQPIKEITQNTTESLIKSAMEKSAVTDDDKKIYEHFSQNFEKYKDGWKEWIKNKTKEIELDYQITPGKWALPDPDLDMELNKALVGDYYSLKTPSEVLSNLQNIGFPGMCLIGSLRQEKGPFLYPSQQFKENFLKEVGVIPSDKTINDLKYFRKNDKNDDLTRPGFDYKKRVEILGNLRGSLDGVSFELDTRVDGNVCMFLNFKTLKKLVE